jgi:hypothetical protein
VASRLSSKNYRKLTDTESGYPGQE